MISSPTRNEGAFFEGAVSLFWRSTRTARDKRSMMDILFIGIGALFFILCIAYTKACDSL
jgi:hypothetical protein